MINKVTQYIRGFTLIETLIAVLLLATAITGPLTIASRGLVAAAVAKDQVIAYYLVQDAIEFVRFARDTNKLGGGNWISGVGAASGIDLTPCQSANGCYFDSTRHDLRPPTACGVAGCSGTPIKYDATTERYAYESGSNTIFTRWVSVTSLVDSDVTDDYEAALAVTISWSDFGNVVHTLSAKESMFNWQP